MFKAGHNFLSDFTQQEYMVMMGLRNQVMDKPEGKMLFTGAASNETLDWRDVQDVVTPVKNQGQCGSCWAFSATEAVESAYVIAGNKQVIMSPQELVDCSRGLIHNNRGCKGGWYYWAYEWLEKHMTMTIEAYPYVSGTTEKANHCEYNSDEGVTGLSDYVEVSPSTEDIKAALELGPVNVAVAAGNDVFRNYTSGIITAADGCPTSIDHAIVAVGYGYEGDQGYYIVRNSWGTGWGEDGYIKIGMQDGSVGICGINQYVYFPVI